MLKALFSSKARVKLLQIFLLNPGEEYFIRELTRVLGEQINSIRRELDNLKKIGLLKSKMRNRKKYYHVNPEFAIYPELRSMFLKAGGGENEIVQKVTKMGEVDLLVLSGMFVGIESQVDLLIVGEVDRTELQHYLTHTARMRREVKFSVISKKDFLYRVECKDKFIHDLLKDRRNLIAINRLKKELEPLAIG